MCVCVARPPSSPHAHALHLGGVSSKGRYNPDHYVPILGLEGKGLLLVLTARKTQTKFLLKATNHTHRAAHRGLHR